MGSPESKALPFISTPLLPLSPSHDNIKHPLAQSPSLGYDDPKIDSANFIYASEVGVKCTPSPIGSGHSSPTRQRNQQSDVQGMVARFNALDIKDHAELRRRDEAALKRAHMAREQAEEEARRTKEECRSMRRDIDEGKERERRVVRRLDAVMEQLHSEKEKAVSMQKTYEREIRRARKEAFKSSSALLETQKELKVTKAALQAARVNLETWVIPDGEELKVRAEGLAYELTRAHRLIEFMKMECQFGSCACRNAEANCGVYVYDSDDSVLQRMEHLKPEVVDTDMQEQPPAYDDGITIPDNSNPSTEDDFANEKQAQGSTERPRRSSTIQPPGETMVFSPGSGTFHRVDPSIQQAQTDEDTDDKSQSHKCQISEIRTISTHDFAPSEEVKTPTTPATSIPPASPDYDVATASEDEREHQDHVQAKENVTPSPEAYSESLLSASTATLPTPALKDGGDETVLISKNDARESLTTCAIDELNDEEDDNEPPESPTTHIRATTQTTTIPLAGMSSPVKDVAESNQHSCLDFEDRISRAETPMDETFVSAMEPDKHEPSCKQAPITPRTDLTGELKATRTPGTKSASDENILSATPWETHATTPLTRDEAIAMLRARRGRARTNAGEDAPKIGCVPTVKRSASHGQALVSANKSTKAPGSGMRRDISTVSAPDLGGRVRPQGSPRKGR